MLKAKERDTVAGDWIKLHRQVIDSKVFSDEFLWRLWCWLLIRANWKKTYYQGIEIQPGQLVFGRNAAASELGTNPSKVYRGIKKLEKFGNIEAKSNSKWTMITICNWTTYQDSKNQSEQRVNSERTASEQRVNSERTHHKKVKNYKEGEEGRNNKTASPSGDGTSKRAYSEEFEEFWKLYPRTEGKKAAFLKYKLAVKELASVRGSPDAACEWLRERVSIFSATSKGKGDFCPHGATWLSQGRYDDDENEWNRSTGGQGRGTERTGGGFKGDGETEQF